MCRRVCVLVLAVSVACSQGPGPSPTTEFRPTTTSTTVPETSVPPPTGPGPPSGGTLHVGTLVPVETLDPADAVTLADWELILNTARGLLSMDPATGDISSGIAEGGPDVSDDGLTYTFHLDPATEFSDGLALTADIYVRSLQRVMQLGGRASELVTSYVARVEAPDDATLVFHLHERFAYFPVLLSSAAYVPVHPDAFPDDQLEPRPDPPIHSVGKWYVADMSDDRIVLERNPAVPADEEGPEQVILHLFASSEDMSAAIGNGDLDLVWRGIGPELERELNALEGVTVFHAPGGVLEFLALNHELAPTDDPLVRRAIATVIDRQTVADQVLEGTVAPAYSPVPVGFLGSADSFRDVYGEPDVAGAIDLLTEAGYTVEDPAHLELAYPPERFGVEIARAMEELERQLESTGLIEVTLTAQAWNTYVGEVVSGAYNVAFLGWVYDFPDPHNFLAPFLLRGGVGGSGPVDEEVASELVSMLEEAAVEPDDERREALYVALQELYAEDVVTLPLWVDPESVAYWDHVSAADGPFPEALNIGPTLRLDYGALRLDR